MRILCKLSEFSRTPVNKCRLFYIKFIFKIIWNKRKSYINLKAIEENELRK
jgi:hypothetical protein